MVLGQLEARVELHERQPVRPVAVDLVGREEDEGRVGGVAPGRLEQVERAGRVDAEVGPGVAGRPVVGGLRGGVDDQLEPRGVPAEHAVDRPRRRACRARATELRMAPRQRPGDRRGRGLGAEEARPHVVLEADHVVAGLDEVANGLRADQSAGAGDDCDAHLASLPGVGRPTRLFVLRPSGPLAPRSSREPLVSRDAWRHRTQGRSDRIGDSVGPCTTEGPALELQLRPRADRHRPAERGVGGGDARSRPPGRGGQRPPALSEPVWGSRLRPYREVRDGVPVLRLPIWVGRRTTAQRVRQELSYTAALSAALPAAGLARRVVATSPSFPALLPTAANARRAASPVGALAPGHPARGRRGDRRAEAGGRLSGRAAARARRLPVGLADRRALRVVPREPACQGRSRGQDRPDLQPGHAADPRPRRPRRPGRRACGADHGQRRVLAGARADRPGLRGLGRALAPWARASCWPATAWRPSGCAPRSAATGSS